jgi:hypothetical protein
MSFPNANQGLLRKLIFALLCAAALVPSNSAHGDNLNQIAPVFSDGFEPVACTGDSDCDFLDVEAICESAETCQGVAIIGACGGSVCIPETIADDSACFTLESADCGLYISVFCTSSVEQPIDQISLCVTSCQTDLDCDQVAHCNTQNECVQNICGDGFVHGNETCDDYNNLACGTCSADCGAIQSPASASGLITTVAADQILDGETLTLSDGINVQVFEFDKDGSTTMNPIHISTAMNASAVKTAVMTAINGVGASLTITAGNGGFNLVSLVNDHAGSLGNQTLAESVSDPEFMVSGMSGGVASDCPASTGCSLPEDCASGSCTNNMCD